MEKSEFIIPIKVRDENELYMSFDPYGMTFSSELADYLGSLTEERRIGEKPCIQIYSAIGINEERFRTAYGTYFDKMRQRCKRDIAKSNANAVRLLLIGVAFIIIGIILAGKINDVAAAIISTIGSFSVWEASAVWIEAIPALRREMKLLEIFAGAEIKTDCEG